MKQADEEEKKEGVIRIVRKRWRGVAPYFYTVWPLLCIIPHLARSSRDAGSRYADPLLRAENPNLPSVSPFRRMMDDARDEGGTGTHRGTRSCGSFPRRKRRRKRICSSRNDERSVCEDLSTVCTK